MLTVIKKALCLLLMVNPVLLLAQTLALFQCPSETQVAGYLNDNRLLLATNAQVIATDILHSVEVDWVKQYECQCSKPYQQQQIKVDSVRFSYAELSSGWMGARMFDKHYPNRPSESGLLCHYQVSGNEMVMIINQIGFPRENFDHDFESLNYLDFSYFMPDSTYTQYSAWQKNSDQQKYFCDRQGFYQQGCRLTLKTTENHDDWLMQVSRLD